MRRRGSGAAEVADERLDAARQAVARLGEELPGLRVDGVPAFQGQTNRVLFGWLDDEPVAIKHFRDTGRRAREALALDHLRASGVVPRRLPVEDAHILVTERLDGEALVLAVGSLDAASRHRVYRGLGAALAAIERVAPRPAADAAWVSHCRTGVVDADFFRHSSWSDLLDTTLQRSRHAIAAHGLTQPDLLDSLDALAESRDALAAEEAFFLPVDFGANNTLARDGRFVALVDLEQSRFGPAAFLVGTGLFHAWRQHEQAGAPLMQGYLEASGRGCDPAFAELCRLAAPLSYWVNFMWYFGMADADLPPWAVAANQRRKILDLLVATVRRAQGL